MKRIIVIRFSSLGDIILTTPTLALLKKQFPTAKIDFVTKDAFVPLLKNHPAINSLFAFSTSSSLRGLSREILQHGKIDLILDLHNSTRSKILRFLLLASSLKSKVLVYKKPYFKRWMLVYFKINLFGDSVKPVAWQYMLPLAKIGIEAQTFQPYIVKEEIRANKASKEFSEKFVLAIAPGARWFNKRWPAKYFIELIELIQLSKNNLYVVIVGSQDESKVANEILDVLQIKKILVQSYCGKLNIKQTATLLSQANLLISNDSALVHLAMAVDTRVVSLFLSTVPEFGFYPYALGDLSLTARVPCAPCDHKGLNKCPKKHFNCAYQLTPNFVFTKIQDAKL